MDRPTVMFWRCFLNALLLGFLLLPQSRPGESQQVEHWEGTLKQGARETYFRMEIHSPERGFLEILGQKLPLEVSSRAAHKIEIRTVESKPTVFRGERHADRITGEVLDERGNASFWMELEPTLPRPQGRSEAWAQDLSYAARKLTLLDRSLTPATRKSFRRATAQLEANAGTFDDPHIMVGLAEAVALVGNAHTRLYLVRNRTEVRQYPIRVWWFRNELRVIRAAPKHADLLGCEVT
ncbi:MAG TPA: hypothetical protein VLL05_13335, partial [Terriglobales bacterium]|nr:hypothetical protein [Terriglobales bacterium]